MISIVQLLNTMYVSLTVAKLSQWAVHTLNRRLGKREDMYTPSMNVYLTLFQYFILGEDKTPNKVPRKELRKVTDPWIEDYKRYLAHGKRKPQTFRSMDDAKSDFFLEFCQETNRICLWWTKYTWIPFANYPLGFCAATALLGFLAVGAPIMLLREVLVFGGGPYSMMCKVRLSSQMRKKFIGSF